MSAEPDRAVALSLQLVQVHQVLRERLAVLHDEIAGGAVPGVAGADLRSHCLSLCTAIHTHHAGEDGQLLPALRAAAPELGPVIDKLIEDHGLVASIVGRISELLAAARPATGPGALARELDGLAAILESHFSFEERRIAAALDTLGPPAWSADVFAPGSAHHEA
ncbi:MAG TPA: hemerythrin domain-containing protein [Streptosporangiaceae bacterium]